VIDRLKLYQRDVAQLGSATSFGRRGRSRSNPVIPIDQAWPSFQRMDSPRGVTTGRSCRPGGCCSHQHQAEHVDLVVGGGRRAVQD